MTEEIHYWADRMADEIIQRVEKNDFLQNVIVNHGFFIYDEKTPSGDIHIGAGRGWIIHDCIAKALRKRGKTAKFVLSSDDYDPFDKAIEGKPEYDKYLGMPFRNIPSPAEGYGSWAEYYFQQATDLFSEWGIKAELESTGKEYLRGTFNAAIKTCLDNTAKIQEIFQKIYDKPYDKIPFNPICEKCGKIGTTLATEWDAKNELIHYECKKDLVKWAKGCGHKGKLSPYNGSGKLPWKVEWAAKWPSKGVIAETAGKDHFTKGGSRTVAIAISDQVLKYPPPYPSTATEEGPGYEFFNVGGKKMSTSKGVGISFAGISEHLPPNILRFLVVSYKPKTVIDFDPTRKDDLLLLYDRYDTAERVYFGTEKSDREEELKQIYTYAYVGDIPEKLPPQISLRHAAVIVQIIGEDDDKGVSLLQKEGEVPDDISIEDKQYLKDRFFAARRWLAEFAPETEKFIVREVMTNDIREKMTQEQSTAIRALASRLMEREYTDQEMHELFYEICEKVGIKNTEFFKGVYLVLLGKERGPKLGSFIHTLGKERVLKLLEQV